MPRFSPEQVAAIQAQADQDPQVQAAVQKAKGARHAGGVNVYGVNPTYLPKGLIIEARTGRVVEPENWSKEWMTVAPIVGAGGLGAAAMGGMFGGAGGSAASVGAPAATEAAIFGSPAATASAAGATGAAGAAASGATSAGRGYAGQLAEQAMGGTSDRLISAALSALAGLPAMMGNRGPSDEENAFQSQATRLLGQQEQRTQFQNPLYEAVTKMAHGLLPNMGNNGQPYPINSLSDVSIPGLDDLLRRRS